MAERAPAGLRDVFVPVERICGQCGARSVTDARTCPQCGSPYVARRTKALGTRRRRLAFAAATVTVAALTVVGVLLLSPGIDRAKRAHATAAQRAAAAADARLVAQQRSQQTLRVAGTRLRDPGTASRAASLRVRAAMLGELQTVITRDTRARVRAGILTGPVLFTSCAPYPSPPPAGAALVRYGAYSCVAVNRPVTSTRGTVAELGDPLWARIDFARGRFAWCKINPRPGEQAVGGGTTLVPLAQACDLSRAPPAGF